MLANSSRDLREGRGGACVTETLMGSRRIPSPGEGSIEPSLQLSLTRGTMTTFVHVPGFIASQFLVTADPPDGLLMGVQRIERCKSLQRLNCTGGLSRRR